MDITNQQYIPLLICASISSILFIIFLVLSISKPTVWDLGERCPYCYAFLEPLKENQKPGRKERCPKCGMMFKRTEAVLDPAKSKIPIKVKLDRQYTLDIEGDKDDMKIRLSKKGRKKK